MIKLYKNEAINFIEQNVFSCNSETINLEGDYYHHNRSYNTTAKIVKDGLLSARVRAEKDNRELTKHEKIMFSDSAYVNGSEYISLARTGLTDLYRDEFEYDPYSPYFTDILISKEVKAFRCSEKYGNEYLALDKIDSNKFLSIDIRLLNLIEKAKTIEDLDQIKKIINNYNSLKNIANSILEGHKDIIMREMSKDNITLDLEKISKLPELELRRR